MIDVQETRYSDILGKHLQERPDAPAIYHMGRTVTYRELYGLVDSYCAHLLEMGVKKGDHVGLWAMNSVAWVAAFMAVIRCGAVAVLFNYGLNLPDTQSVAEMTDLNALLYGTTRASMKNPEAASVLASGVGIPQGKMLNIEKAPVMPLSDGQRAMLEQSEAQRSCRETSIFIFTTGTTSMPKAVMLSEYAVINDGRVAGYAIGSEIRCDICVALPLFHSFGLSMLTLVLASGRCAYLPEELKPEAILPIMERFQAECFASVGAVYMGLARHPDFPEKMGKIVKAGLIGGGVSTPSQLLQMETAFENAKLINGYGQTESAPIISCPTIFDPVEKRMNTVGKPLPHLEVRIGGGQKTGEIGEVLVRGFNLMNGYYKMPREKQAIDEDGWLHTGDIGFLDEEGYLTLSGRIKDIIIRAGENIAPSEIEKEMIRLPEIAEAKVLGANHHILGESVEACVVPRDGAVIDERSIREALKKTLSTIKIPEHFFVYDRFPLNENGKLDQRALKADMLMRLRKLGIAQMLDDGMCILSMQVKNTVYNIVPTVSAMHSLAGEIGFKESKANRIRLAVEEMMTERILNAYENVGNISVSVILMPTFMRIAFTDGGKPMDIEENRKTSLSVRLILSMADSFSFSADKEGRNAGYIDFLYENNFDIEEYLARSERQDV